MLKQTRLCFGMLDPYLNDLIALFYEFKEITSLK